MYQYIDSKTTYSLYSLYILLLTALISPIFPQKISDSLLIDTTEVYTEPPSIIKKIIIDGNHRTRAKTIVQYMQIDSGDIYDSAKIPEAEARLRNSGLFNHVKIHPIVNGPRAMLLVVVRENRYFTISSIGGVIYNKRYGEKTDRIWIQGYGTLRFSNFRGRDEEVGVSASLIRNRYVGISWYKPFITVPWYISLGTRIGSQPSVITPWHIEFYNSSYLKVGRKFSDHTTIYSRLSGRYLHYDWKGDEGTLYVNGVATEPINKTELLELGYGYNNNWVHYEDSVYFNNKENKWDTLHLEYKWLSNDTNKIKRYEVPFSDLHISLVWVIDKRDNSYNSHRGFYNSFAATTNALYPYKDFNLKEKDLVYLQLANDFRFYHRGIWESNTVAYRIRPFVRLFGKGNIHSGVYMGNEYTLRGFDSGAFGGFGYNHRLLLSWEYRFHIFNLPELNFPWLAWYDNSLNKFIVRIDGAVLFDYGYLWKDLLHPRSPAEDHRVGAGAGFGFRFVSPSLKRSVCAEMVFPVVFPENYFSEYRPALYLYLDLPF